MEGDFRHHLKIADPMGGDITEQTSNIALNSLNISIAGTVIAFSYVSVEDRLIFGGLVNSINHLVGLTNDFVVVIPNISTSPSSIITFGYTSEATAGIFNPSFSSLVVTETTVPEPPALALFSVGLAMLVFLRLRRRWSLAFRDSVAWIVGSYPCAPNRRSPNRPSV